MNIGGAHGTSASMTTMFTSGRAYTVGALSGVLGCKTPPYAENTPPSCLPFRKLGGVFSVEVGV